MQLPSSSFEYSPIAIAQGSDFFKKLPLFQFYNKVKSFYTIPKGSHHECKNLAEYKELQNICNKLRDILGNIEEFIILVDVDNNNRSCQYLNYLIQEEIEKEKCKSNTLHHLYEALTSYKNSEKNYECKFEQNTNTDTKIAETRKKLHYYAEYLYWIKEKFKDIENTQKDEYFQFLNAFILYYNRLLRHAICNNSKKYETELNDFKKKYDEVLEHIIKKYSDIKPKPMENDEEANKSCPTAQQVNQDGEQEIPLYSTSPYFSQAPISRHSIRSDLNPIDQDSIPQDSKSSTIGKATPIICSAVAISMFSFILHKFTPLGTYLRRNKLIDRNRMDEKQDDNYKLLSDASRIPHNIAYQPVGN